MKIIPLIFLVATLFNSISFSENLVGIKKCHDAILNDVIGWGFVSDDVVFIPSNKDKSQFLLSNGKDKHYFCSTQPDILKDRAQIFINQNIEGLSKSYIAAKNDNRKNWNLIAQAIDAKKLKLIADCKKTSAEDKSTISLYTEHTQILLQELKLDYNLKVASTVDNYDLTRIKTSGPDDAKQIASKETNKIFWQTLDLCRESKELEEVVLKSEKNIKFVIIDRKNARTSLPSRDKLTPTKVKSATSIALPPAPKQ
ncbi:MAG: hypothetical protein H7328_05320 [Bdellovibrio sp.]|nr:hypothetical protein [Bdellovibrio sp.]